MSEADRAIAALGPRASEGVAFESLVREALALLAK
jgi:hypothetical protein